MKKCNIDDLIKEAVKIHGNRYDYSKAEYRGWREKVCIICPEHGEFWQTMHNHNKGQGCPICGKKSAALKMSSGKERFIEKAKEVHGDKYDYSKVEYINSKTKVCIICPEHGEFWQIPANHLRGVDCPYCKHNLPCDTEMFIEKAKKVHGEKYDYSKVNYVNNHTHVCIVCPKHGEFWQTPNKHLRGDGCPNCSLSKKLEQSDFLRKAKEVHGDKYDYSKVEYINSKTKVCIICPEHGEFWQIPANHLMGAGCPKCNERESRLEKDVRDVLTKANINYIFQYKEDWLRYKNPMAIDFYLPEYKIAIECQGEQHYIPVEYFGGKKKLTEVQKRDKTKFNLCKKHGIKVLYYGTNKFEENIITDKNNLIKEIRND